MALPTFDESKIIIWVGDNGHMTPQQVGGDYSADFPPRWTIADKYKCDTCKKHYKSWATDAEHWLKLPSFLWKSGVFLCVDCFRLLVQPYIPEDVPLREKMMAYIRDNRAMMVSIARQIFNKNYATMVARLGAKPKSSKPKRH